MTTVTDQPQTILGVAVKAPQAEPEPVLDTVIDLTDPSATRRRPGPRGSAEDDFARVALLVNTGVPPGEAIARVARKTGKARDTIQNNYYRTKRKLRAEAASGTSEAVASRRDRQEDPARKTKRRVRRPPVRQTEPRVLGIDALASELLTTMERLVDAATAQTSELAELRAQVAAMRRALDSA